MSDDTSYQKVIIPILCIGVFLSLVGIGLLTNNRGEHMIVGYVVETHQLIKVFGKTTHVTIQYNDPSTSTSYRTQIIKLKGYVDFEVGSKYRITYWSDYKHIYNMVLSMEVLDG